MIKQIFLISTILILASACSHTTKKTLGLTEELPDEYQVQRNKALEVPPCYQGNSVSTPKKSAKNKSNFSNEEQALLNEIK